MKKIMSILLAFTMLLSTVSLFTITSFAQETTKYWEPRPNPQGALGCVNDEPADGIYTVADEEYNAARIEYLGDGTLTGWEFPTLTEGEDYKIIKQYDNVIIVKFTDGVPYINALVNFSDTADSTANYSNQSAIQNTNQEPETANQNNGDASITADDNEPIAQAVSNEVTAAAKNTAKAMAIETPEHNTISSAKMVIAAVSIGAALCLVIVFIMNNKKASKKTNKG